MLRISSVSAVAASLAFAPFVPPAAAQLPLDDPALVNTATAGDQESPAIGMRDDGLFVVVWTDRASTSGDISLRLFLGNGAPFPVGTLNQFTTGLQLFPAISMNSGGDWVAGWQSHGQIPASARTLFGRYTSGDGTVLLDELQLNATAAHDTLELALSRAEDGTFVAAWRDNLDLGQVYARRFAANGASLTGDLIANQTTPLSSFLSPAVASAPDGAFVVTWRAGTVTTAPLRMRLFAPDCTPLSGDLPVDDVTTGTRIN